jgi:hypothetical protein
MQGLIDGVIDAAGRGQDVAPLINMLATMPNISTGKEFGVEAIEKLIADGKEKAGKRIAAAKKKLEKVALEKSQAELKAEVSKVELSDELSAVLTMLVAKATGLDAYVVVSANEEGKLSFSVSGLKAPSKGGGKPAKDQPRPFLDSEGDRICGTLTSWAKENLSPPVLASAPHKGEGDKRKLRSGSVLETFLKGEHEVNGSKVGPFIVADSSAKFTEEFAAWTAAQNSDETEETSETEDSDTEANTPSE